jgi:serine/threonine-protein kinase RsbW
MGAADVGCIFLPSRASALGDARRFVDQVAARAGFADPAREEISLAVTEAVSNAIRHGSPAGEADQVELSAEWQPPRLVVTVRDHGSPFSPPAPSLPDPATFAEHGRGLFLMHHLMDEIQFETNGGTVVRMTRTLPA